MFSKLNAALVVAVVLAAVIPAVAQAQSTVSLPAKGKVVDGHIRLTVTFSCPATTTADDALLWLTVTQFDPLAAGDNAFDVICDGKRRKYRAVLEPNIGEPPVYVPGTAFIEASIGNSGQLARDSAVIPVR